MPRTARFGFPTAAALATLAGLLALEGPAGAATAWTVHVGRGGTQFVDEASGTNISTVQVGDTINWVWEGTMMHSVTSGSCTRGGGGGGYGGYGGDVCTDAGRWPTTGLQSSGFTFSQTFSTPGTFSYYCAQHQSAMTGTVVVQPATAGACVVDEHTLCLNAGRFQVRAHWARPDGSEGEGTGIPLTADSGYFWFFDSTNIEVVVKVLNGCALTDAYWVFAAGLTNIAVDLTVTDTATGAVYTRNNAQGFAFAPVQATTAFPTSCP